LNHASEDDSLAAVYLNVTELGMYYASAFELADAIRNIKNNGKRVIAYGENFTNNSYLISSQANEVILNEYGGISSFGFSRKRQYVKDLYENIKINYHVFVAGDFKTAPEPYTRTTMSEEDKIAWKDFSDPLWKKMTQLMENGRNLTSGTMQNYGDNFWELSQVEPEISKIALEKGLVDQVMNVEETGIIDKIRNGSISLYQHNDMALNKGVVRKKSVNANSTADIVDIRGRCTVEYDLIEVKIDSSGGTLTRGTDNTSITFSTKGHSSAGLQTSDLVTNQIISGGYDSIGRGLEVRFSYGVLNTNDSWEIECSGILETQATPVKMVRAERI